MPAAFHIDIASPDKTIYTGEVVSAIVPAEYGYMGILANHAPLVARLEKGKIILRDSSNNTQTFNAQTKGFVEILKNKVTILVDSVVV